MLVFLIVLLSILFIISIYIALDINTFERTYFSAGIIIGIIFLTLLLGIITCTLSNFKRIKPIDVYRGKTELRIIEIKENDQVIKCDTTVIFKSNIK